MNNFNIENIKEYMQKSKYKNEMKDIIKEHNLKEEDIKELINNLTIYSDYDDVLVELIKPWVKDINDNLGTNYTKKDVKSFFWFDQFNPKIGFNFLNNREVYDKIKLKSETKTFFKILEKNNLLKNLHIVTATVPQNVESKDKHIKKNFSKYIDPKTQKTTTSAKWMLDFTNAILIDDRSHNRENVVMANPYAITFILNDFHNSDLYTGKRIIRVNSILEIFQHLPYVVLINYDRHFNPKYNYLKKEAMKSKHKLLEEAKKKLQIEKDYRKKMEKHYIEDNLKQNQNFIPSEI